MDGMSRRCISVYDEGRHIASIDIAENDHCDDVY